MHHSCLCNSAKKMSSKPFSQFAVKNVIGQSVCGVFFNFKYAENYLKTHALHD